jgi:RNA polymerase sigma factor (sigma-70 family)
VAAKLDPEQLRKGDRATIAAFELVLRRRIREFFKKPSLVNVLTNTALVELLEKLDRGEQPTVPLYWALNAASNVARRELTRLRRIAVSFDSRLHSRAPEQHLALEARDDLDRIDALLAEVDEVPQQVLAAAAQGHTSLEIATKLGLSPEAVRASLSRLRGHLKDGLASQGQLDGLRRLAREAGLIPKTTGLQPASSSS